MVCKDVKTLSLLVQLETPAAAEWLGECTPGLVARLYVLAYHIWMELFCMTSCIRRFFGMLLSGGRLGSQ